MQVVSFSYKYDGPPGDAVVFDCRDMANPHHHPGLKPLDGRHMDVQAFVARDPNYSALLMRARAAAKQGSPKIAFGCVGGRHRSVAMAELFSTCLEAVGVCATVEHLRL